MTIGEQQIIDTCCLLDLYAGWYGLEPLAQLNGDWYLCPTVLGEAQYIRDVDPAGKTVKVSVDLKPSLEKRIIHNVDVSDEEFERFLQLAGQLGDGEAMSLAVAMHRGWILATDDGKAMKMAQEVGVETTSTPEVIKAWADLDEDNLGQVREVLQNIERRAHFKPTRSSPFFVWWHEYAGN